MTTPNGWPASTRSIRPGTPSTDSRPARTAAGFEPERLAERDDREGVVDVEPAGETELEVRRARWRVVGDPEPVGVLLDCG